MTTLKNILDIVTKKTIFFIVLCVFFPICSQASENYSLNKADMCVGELVSASIEGNISRMAKLIKYIRNNKECSINSKDGNSLTALMYAATYGHNNIVQELLKNGANPNLKNKFGATALMLASGNDYADVATTLLKNGANPNSVNKYGTTALMLAAGNGYVDVVITLLKNGANANMKDNMKHTALFIAQKKNHHEVVKKLKEVGAR